MQPLGRYSSMLMINRKLVQILSTTLLLLLLFGNQIYALSGIEIKSSQFTDKDQLRVSVDGEDFKNIYEEKSSGLDYSLPFRDSYYLNFLFTRWVFNRTKVERLFELPYPYYTQLPLKYDAMTLTFIGGISIPLGENIRMLSVGIGFGVSYLDFKIGELVEDKNKWGQSKGVYISLIDYNWENGKLKFVEYVYVSSEVKLKTAVTASKESSFRSTRKALSLISYTYYWF